jgi:DMSO/TMAO reductase YedYZ heme-binding membrane subunit
MTRSERERLWRNWEGQIQLKELLKNKAPNGWPLFWLISAPMSLIMVIAMMGRDMTNPEDVSHMIGFSVRWAVPFIFLVAATSSLQKLFPGPAPGWLLRNRKYTGLCFAVAMGWQGLFIFMMTNIHRGYYFEEIFFLRDELEGSTGYLFLAAMVVTSFKSGRRPLTSKQWRLLHLTGLYFLFAYPFSVYWWNLYYFENPTSIDYVFYWMGFVAFTLRIAAWGSKRLKEAARKTPDARVPAAFRAAGGALIVFGLIAAATGLGWQEPVSGLLLAPVWSANLELWLPFWPFEPFLPLFIIGFGTLLLTRVSTDSGPVDL